MTRADSAIMGLQVDQEKTKDLTVGQKCAVMVHRRVRSANKANSNNCLSIRKL